MQSVWMIYDTKYGNNAKLAGAVQAHFQGVFDIQVGSTRATKPRAVIEGGAYGLIIGGPIRFGKPSRAITRWITSLGKEFANTGLHPEKAATYCTAFGDPDKGQLILQAAQQAQIAEVIDPACIGLMVEDLKGPFKADEIDRFTAHLRQFFLS